jgi:RNA polymerase sigma-70 factor (ECF subfamily)
MPEGYKVIFNLYAIEGFKHKEIAVMLNITESTSKSQYSRAKEKIRQELEIISKIKIQNA